MEAPSDLLRLDNFIGGQFVPPAQGKYLDSFNPSTGEVFCLVPDSQEEDVQAAVACAKGAFPGWAKDWSTERRAALLHKVADLIEARLEEFARAESQDQGKPVGLARAVDIPRAVSNFRFFASAILSHEEMSTTIEGAVNYTVREPVGVAGLISPWNLPLYLLTWKVAPALAVGNTVVAKPSELTSVTAWMLAKVMVDAGVPDGVCNFVFGRGPTAGAALVRHPDVPLISFTGGTATAEQIIKDSAPHYKKLSLELGGKNPNIIFADADLTQCVPTSIRSSFANQGEICLCGSRIFVQRPIYEEFKEKFIQETEKLVVGDPKDPKTNLGALISKEHLAKVQYYIELAKEEGGAIEAGGQPPSVDGELSGGYFLRPTVITGLPPTCRVQQEEIFGPVVTITPFDSEEEVIEMANGVRYGLSASLWTENVKRAHRVGQALKAGTVWVNTWLKRDLRVPFGGMKHSGVGREGGTHSLDFYSEQKTICISL
ncbi:Aldehyde dehydrogenase 8 member A1 [Balamuthia mandrillaris]